MTPEETEMRKALRCLYQAADARVCHDLEVRVNAAFDRLRAEVDEYKLTVSRVWEALGCAKFEDAKGMAIWELVSASQRRVAELEAAGKSALCVLCATRNGQMWSANMLEDYDFAIEATRSALSAQPAEGGQMTLSADDRDLETELWSIIDKEGFGNVGSDIHLAVAELSEHSRDLDRLRAEVERLKQQPDPFAALHAECLDDLSTSQRRVGELTDALVQAEACMSIVEPRSDKAEYLRILGVVRSALSAVEPRQQPAEIEK